MKQRTQITAAEKSPEQEAKARRLEVVDNQINMARVTQRVSKDIEAKAEAVEIERLLLARRGKIEAEPLAAAA